MALPKEAMGGKAAEKVAAELRRVIVTGNLRPGDRLQTERQLQEEFNVSRPTLREALRMLESESLVEIIRGKGGGARVTQLDPNVLAQQIGVCLQIEGITLQDVWQSRKLIEPAAASLLTTSGNRAAILELEENVRQSEEMIDDPVAFANLTTGFSHILTEHCGNRTIHILSMSIRDIIDRQCVAVTVKTYARPGVDRMRNWNIVSRKKMIELIRSGNDHDAETYWRKHLEVSGQVVFSNYQGQMPIDVVNAVRVAGG